MTARWYLVRDTQRYGPYDETYLRELVQAGNILGDESLEREGDGVRQIARAVLAATGRKTAAPRTTPAVAPRAMPSAAKPAASPATARPTPGAASAPAASAPLADETAAANVAIDTGLLRQLVEETPRGPAATNRSTGPWGGYDLKKIARRSGIAAALLAMLYIGYGAFRGSDSNALVQRVESWFAKPPAEKPASAKRHFQDIARAFQDHEQEHGRLPPRAFSDPTKYPYLSWRVKILPYVGHLPLYKMFLLNEPWNSPHNESLIPLMPAIYGPEAAKGKTRLQLLVGEGTAYLTIMDSPLAVDIRDGHNRTLLLVEAPETNAVPWTRPEDWEVDLKASPSRLFADGSEPVTVMFFSGDVQQIPPNIAEDHFRALVTPNRGEKLTEFPPLRAFPD